MQLYIKPNIQIVIIQLNDIITESIGELTIKDNFGDDYTDPNFLGNLK